MVPEPAPIQPSLREVNASVDPSRAVSQWKRLLAFAGPAYLVSVGYMDPGNWATDLEGGARFGYQLLWVLVLSNLMAILLQTLSARLGIVAGRDLAQACRESYPRAMSIALWLLCEVAIVACDLAEVLGAAIALKLLFGLPLVIGVVVTALDTLLLLWLTRFGIRMVEAMVLVLVLTIGVYFGIEMLLAQPVLSEIVTGLAPRLTNESLYVAIGILGATVMPHNLYLHSALVQTRRIGKSEAEKRSACRYNLIDSVVALNAALFVNAGILIMAASVFHKNGIAVKEIEQAHVMLAPLLGTTVASLVFAIALLASGQSSTMTGTLAGQIVMEGFVNIRLRPWLRRVITRMLAIVPAVATIVIAGDQASYKLLILSQVVLSLQLPFAVIPLIHFTSDKARMGAFANRTWVRVLAWLTALIIVGLNIRLVWQVMEEWLGTASGPLRLVLLGVVIPAALGLAALLAWVTLQPVLPRWLQASRRRDAGLVRTEREIPALDELPSYGNILVTLDHTDLDRAALLHASAMAKLHGARLHLLHIEEDVVSRIYGAEASSLEVEAGRAYLERQAGLLRSYQLAVDVEIRYSSSPGREIVRYAKEIGADLVVMGAHGHTGLKDIAFGATIEAVRHALSVPVLIVRDKVPGTPS